MGKRLVAVKGSSKLAAQRVLCCWQMMGAGKEEAEGRSYL